MGWQLHTITAGRRVVTWAAMTPEMVDWAAQNLGLLARSVGADACELVQADPTYTNVDGGYT